MIFLKLSKILHVMIKYFLKKMIEFQTYFMSMKVLIKMNFLNAKLIEVKCKNIYAIILSNYLSNRHY